MNRNVTLALVGVFFVFMAQTATFVLLPLAAVDRAVQGVGVGFLLALFAGMGLATDILVATVSDRVGRRLPLLVGTFLGTLGGVILAVSSNFVGLAGGASALGFAMSLVAGPALAYLTEACRPSEAARVQGYNGSVLGLSALAGAIGVTVLVERLGFLAAGSFVAFAMAAALIAFLQLEETVIERRPIGLRSGVLTGYGAALGLMAQQPRLQLSALVALTRNSVVLLSGNAFLALYLVQAGEPISLAGVLLALRNIGMVISAAGFGDVLARTGLVRAMLTSNVLAIFATVSIAVTVSPLAVGLSLAVQGIGVGLSAPTANTLVRMATSQQERALGFAASSVVSAGGTLLSPLLFGLLLENGGARSVFVGAAALGLCYVLAMTARARGLPPMEPTAEALRR